MSIKPKCDKCGKELTKFGAILFSPPDKDSRVRKHHVCADCYPKITRSFKSK